MQQQINSTELSRTEKENFWLPLVRQWQESKESSKSFSERHNLNLDQFNYWRRKFLSNLPVNANQFIKVEVEPNKTVPKSSIQIELLSGIKITLLGGADKTQLTQIFSLLGI